MNNDQPEDNKWTMPESAGSDPNDNNQPVSPPPPIEPAHTAPPPPPPPSTTSSSFGSSLIAPQASPGAPPPPPQKATKHIYGHQKKRTGLGMRLAVTFFGLLLIGGVGYLGMTLINTGEEKIASTLQVAWGDPLYEGDGSDILKIVSPKSEYTCPEGYGETGTKENPTCSKTIVKTKSPINYSCPKGYTKSSEGGSTKCSKIVGGTKVAVAAKSVFSCAKGYTKSGGGASAKCLKTQTSKPTKSYSCVADYLLTGDGKESRCVKSDSSQGPVNGSCPGGYAAYGSGVSTACKRFKAINTSTTYSCPKGTESGSGSNMKCTTDAKPYSYRCPVGFTGGPICTKTIPAYCQDIFRMSGSGKSRRCLYTKAAKKNYKRVTTVVYGCKYSGSTRHANGTCTRTLKSCSSGESKSGGVYGYYTCTSYVVARNSVTYPFSHYSCPWSGFSGGRTSSVCKLQGTVVVPAQSKCPSGTNFGSDIINGFDRECFKNGAAIAQYACSSVPQNSSKCVVGATASSAGSCNAGYKKSGSRCEKSTKPSFSCSNGFAKVLTSGKIKCLKISMNTINPKVTANCPSKMTLTGARCSKTVTKSAKATKTCTSEYKLSGNKCTKIVGGTLETTKPKESFGCTEGYAQIGEGSGMKCVKSVRDVRKMKYELVCEDGWFRREVGSKVDCAKTASGKKPAASDLKQ